MSGSDEDGDPLKAESARRKEWRGDEIRVDPAASGHTLPASEEDVQSVEGGQGPAPRTISPPD